MEALEKNTKHEFSTCMTLLVGHVDWIANDPNDACHPFAYTVVCKFQSQWGGGGGGGGCAPPPPCTPPHGPAHYIYTIGQDNCEYSIMIIIANYQLFSAFQNNRFPGINACICNITVNTVYYIIRGPASIVIITV